MKRENVFKEKLYQHTMPVRDGLWDAIEAQLPAKKDQRIFPLFWFTLFSATLLGGVLMLGVFNQKNLNTHPANLPQTSIADASMADEEKQNAQQTAPSTNESTQESNTTSSTDDITNTTSSNNTIINNSSSQTSNQKNNKSTGRNQVTPVVKRGTTSKSTSISASMDNSVDSDNISSSSSSSTLALASNVSNRNHANNEAIDFLPQQDVYLEVEESEMATVSMLKPDPNCYKFSGTGNKLVLSADVYGGPGFSPKSYTHTNDESSIVYADARKATENNQYAWSIGARVNLQHRSGFTGRIGINYTQVGDLFDYTDSLATQSTTVTDSFFAADGTFLYTETTQKLILGTLIKKIHNTYRYLDIPLIIGYEMPMGRSTILVNAGPVFNLTSSHEGQILDANLHPRSITEGDAGAIDVYKTNIGMSLYLGAGYLFPISDQFSGLIEPSFIYRLDPVTLDSYPLQEHRHYAGLNVGIRYHFH